MTQAAELPDWMEERVAADHQTLELAPDEARAFSLFISLGTQWTRHAMTGLRLGIDYAAIRPTAEMMGVAMTPALFGDLRLMESAALDEFARAAR